MQVHELSRALVEAEAVCDPCRFATGWGQHELEAEAADDVGEVVPRRAIDEEVDVATAVRPALTLAVTLPLAVPPAAAGERRAEPRDERHGCHGARARGRRGGNEP
jgi:hypothetical protein